MQFVHDPTYGETARNAYRQRDQQEQHPRGIKRQIGNQEFAKNGEDGREDKDRQGVLAKEQHGVA